MMKSTSWLFLLACVSIAHGVDPVVSIAQGLVQGTLSSDGEFSSFLGIPFATVDHENPFGDALPAPVFDEIFQAIDDSAICPQISQNVAVGTLDCLHLNIYAPSSASSTNPLPVMVWIFGGAFSLGSSDHQFYGPEFIIRHDVILVAINYRVGAYGFMCLDIPSVPGNTGLKDQQLGLRWVIENIAAFGGDPNSITAFGQSAGAMSLGLHFLNPTSIGLFDRAILQSGSALVEGIIVYSRPSAPIEIAEHLGYNAESVEEALEIIKVLPTNDITQAVNSLGITFKPCIEETFEGVNHFLEEFPDIILASEEYETVPILIGYTNDEQLGLYITNRDDDDFFRRIQNIIYERMNASFAFISPEQAEIASNIVKQFYIGTRSVDADVAFELNDFDSDIHFVHPIERFISYWLSKSDNPIYQYVFAYSGGVNLAKVAANILEGGAIHADDLGYIFRGPYTPSEIAPEDQLMIDRFTTMWTNFAKYGDPTPVVTDLIPFRWPVVSPDTREYLLMDNDLSIQRKHTHDRMAFWDLFFETFREYYRMVWVAGRYDVY